MDMATVIEILALSALIMSGILLTFNTIWLGRHEKNLNELQKNRKLVTKKGTYTFTPHEAIE